MRESKKGKPPVVSIGYGTPQGGKSVFTVYSKNDLENAGRYDILMLGSVGKKNKMAILKKAAEMKIEFSNVNARRFLKRNESK